MQVQALEPGYDNQKVREPGDVFEMPEGSFADWFRPVNEADLAAYDRQKKDDAVKREKDRQRALALVRA